MRKLNYEIKTVLEKSRQGSYSTQQNRARMLSQAADDLHRLGYRNLALQGLKQKHVTALVNDWHAREIATGTIKNRMSAIRWLAAKVGKPGVVARDNAHYGIDKRTYVTNVSKAKTLDSDKLSNIKDPHINMSLQLQAAFGLRRSESLKFSPSYADKGDYIDLKSSWCKGGRPRSVSIRNAEQRRVLDEAHKLAGRGSMIPSAKRYIDQLRTYEKATARAGMLKLHGLRHQFAQDYFRELTGREPPALGGQRRKGMSEAERLADDAARMKISEALGHGRIDIVAVYIGS